MTQKVYLLVPKGGQYFGFMRWEKVQVQQGHKSGKVQNAYKEQ